MYKILDLFAGAGGLSLGFEMTGLFSVKAIVENNDYAAETYIKNHSGLKRYSDILDVDFKKMNEEIGEIDVVIGGPPCQGFSNANRQRRKLINGSNELVKGYVKAIEEIKPKIFVMENVKTIASDKHSFCLNRNEEEYIKNTLNIQIHNKEVLMYDGEYVNEVYELYKKYENNIEEVIALTEEQLYILYNIIKKKDKLDKYFSRENNVKRVDDIIKIMDEKTNLPEWYNKYTIDIKKILKNLINNKNIEDEKSIIILKQYWKLQRFYQGIKELKDKESKFIVFSNNMEIYIRMETYIVIDYIKKVFNNLGYTTNEEILNAASFGVPQNRERFILIGVRNDYKKVKREDIILPTPIIENPNEYITVDEAIKDLQFYTPTTGSMDIDIKIIKEQNIDTYYKKMVMNQNNDSIYNHVCTLSRKNIIERFKRIEQGKNFHSLPNNMKNTYENPARTQNTIYKRLNPNKPSDTVVNVRKSMWIHPYLNRAVSAREAARLQSFPDNYKFYGTKDSVYQQIGNAVPPLLGRAVAESVLDILGNNNYEKLKDVFFNIRE